jgi:septal ring factor EnvC (AmiA/AmiB activator)
VLIIDHGGGWTTTVTGLASLSVNAGEAIDQGDAIGRVAGDRPRVTIELRRGGHPIDLSAMILAG